MGRTYLHPFPGTHQTVHQYADHGAAGRYRGCSGRTGHLPVRVAALRNQSRTDPLVSRRTVAFPLPVLPGHRYHPGFALRQIRRQRQHFGRRYTRAVRHVAQKFLHRPPQLLDFGRRRCDHHRIRRFGRSRGPDRPDGCGHRVERQPPGPPELQKHHPAALLRRGGSPRSHLQSPDHGRGFRARNSDARSHLAHGRTAADLFDHGRRHRPHDPGIRSDHRHLADSRRCVPAQPNSAFRPAGYLLRADVLLLHHGQCPGGRLLQKDRQSLQEVADRRSRTRHP